MPRSTAFAGPVYPTIGPFDDPLLFDREVKKEPSAKKKGKKGNKSAKSSEPAEDSHTDIQDTEVETLRTKVHELEEAMEYLKARLQRIEAQEQERIATTRKLDGIVHKHEKMFDHMRARTDEYVINCVLLNTKIEYRGLLSSVLFQD